MLLIVFYVLFGLLCLCVSLIFLPIERECEKLDLYFQQTATSCFHSDQWCTIRSSQRPVSKIQFPQYNALFSVLYRRATRKRSSISVSSPFCFCPFFPFPFTQDDRVYREILFFFFFWFFEHTSIDYRTFLTRNFPSFPPFFLDFLYPLVAWCSYYLNLEKLSVTMAAGLVVKIVDSSRLTHTRIYPHVGLK